MSSSLNNIFDKECNDMNSDINYRKELEKLIQKISDSLSVLDINKTGKIKILNLFSFLKQRTPPERKFNEQLFKTLINKIPKDSDDQIELNQFLQTYIQNREELKNYLDAYKQEYDKDKVHLRELQQKIFELKTENENNEKSLVLEIGQIVFYDQSLDNNDLIYCSCLLDEDFEKKTATKNKDNLNFDEKLIFPINSFDSELYIRIFSNNKGFICETKIPINILKENEEHELQFPIYDIIQQNELGKLNPKILLITSYYIVYKKESDDINKKLKENEIRIQNMSEALESISDPFKYIFESADTRGHALQIRLIDNVENILKSNFNQESVKWIEYTKILLFICILFNFITTLDKNDLFSLFLELTIIVIIQTGKKKMIFESDKNFFIFFSSLIFALLYDIIDFIWLRKINVKEIRGLKKFVAIFNFLGFIGKLLICLFLWISKLKWETKGTLY